MNLINDEKHYNTLNNYYRYKYNKKVFKIALNGNFSCPNNGGCIYCSEMGSGEYGGDINKSLKEQFDDIKQMMEKKWKDAKYIVYFQANTNTYAPLNVLKRKYEEALSLDDNIIGISISTRPDCLSNDIIAYLQQLSKKTNVQIELGLQSSNDTTLKFINRGHDSAIFKDCVLRLQNKNINIIAHIINGLPNETSNDMINTAKFVASLNLDGIKIHMLNVLKNTRLSEIYLNNPFPILSLNDYAIIVSKQITYLPKTMIIHRITGDAPKELLIAPLWTIKKFVVMNEIDKYMRKNKLFQGMNYNS